MAAIQLEELSFRYPGAEADTLAPLSLSVADGTDCFIGCVGAGKHLLNLLSGLLTPSRGVFCSTPMTCLIWLDDNVMWPKYFSFRPIYVCVENLAFPLRARKLIRYGLTSGFSA